MVARNKLDRKKLASINRRDMHFLLRCGQS